MKPMRRPSVFIGVCLLAVVVLSAAGYAAYWYSAAGKVRAEIARWAVQQRAAGWQVDISEPVVGGFPFRIDVAIASAVLSGPGTPAQWRWVLPPIAATAKPWQPLAISVSAPGLHRVAAGKERIEITAATADADVTAGAAGLKAGEIRLSGVSATAADGMAFSAGSLLVRIGPRTLRDDLVTSEAPKAQPAGLGLDVSAKSISLPAVWKLALGEAVESVALDAVITGGFEPRGSLPTALEKWRDSGGAMEIASFEISWQALRLRATGTFALDGDLQPQGATTAEIEGIDRTADALIAAGLIDARTAFAAKVANKALTLGGGPVRLPLTIQNRRLFLGPVPLLTLKAISWE